LAIGKGIKWLGLLALKRKNEKNLLMHGCNLSWTSEIMWESELKMKIKNWNKFKDI